MAAVTADRALRSATTVAIPAVSWFSCRPGVLQRPAVCLLLLLLLAVVVAAAAFAAAETKRTAAVAAAALRVQSNASPESWPLGAKTVRESSDSFDPPKGSFQYNPSSRQCVTWSDSRSRIAIVAVGNLFGFDLNYENSRFLVLCRVSWVQTESRERLA